MKPSPDPRSEWALSLLLAGLILLASIEIGRVLGFRILAKAVEQTPVVPAVHYTPVPQASLAPVQVRNWKANTVVQVAPDPRFPDPHVTAAPPPPSPPPQTPRPRRIRLRLPFPLLRSLQGGSPSANPTAGGGEGQASPQPTVEVLPTPLHNGVGP